MGTQIRTKKRALCSFNRFFFLRAHSAPLFSFSYARFFHFGFYWRHAHSAHDLIFSQTLLFLKDMDNPMRLESSKLLPKLLLCLDWFIVS